MSNELIPAQSQALAPASNPFNRALTAPGMNVGAVAIESERAVAEAQGQLVLAKKFPRDETSAHAELMRACKSRAFAEIAFYTVPNRGSGPSIRFAEEVARVYGNFQYGHRELSRSDGKSEIEVYAWDMEKNNRSIRQITVNHIQDTKNGPKVLRDQADIDNKIANVASKQVRGRIMALMPKWLVEEAIQECRKTLQGANEEPIEVRVRKMTQAFAKFGVTPAHLERYLGHKLDQTLIDDLVDLTGIYNALKEGVPASEYFGASSEDEGKQEAPAAAAAINQQVQENQAKPETTRRPRAQQAKSNATETDSKSVKAEDPEPEQKSPAPEPEKEAPPTQSDPADEPTVGNQSDPLDDDPF